MDKFLLAAFLSALAGFITAIISVVKLVNEKEGKISDSRRLWNDSLRKSIADLTSKLTAMTVDFEEQSRFMGILAEEKGALIKSKDEEERRRLSSDIDATTSTLKDVQLDIQEKRHELYLSYAFTRLHFKPNDISFDRVEQKYNLISTLQDSLFYEGDHDKRIELKSKIYSHIDEMIGISRDILKTEWEIVKRGEPTYEKTKRYSIWGGVVMLFLLVSIGIHAFLLVTKEVSNSTQLGVLNDQSGKRNFPPLECWQIQSINKKVFKFNSCTGEFVELSQGLSFPSGAVNK